MARASKRLRSAIRSRLRTLGLTQTQLAEKAGVKPSYISHLLKEPGGNDNPGLELVEKIADALGVSLAYLISEADDETILIRAREILGTDRNPMTAEEILEFVQLLSKKRR